MRGASRPARVQKYGWFTLSLKPLATALGSNKHMHTHMLMEEEEEEEEEEEKEEPSSSHLE